MVPKINTSDWPKDILASSVQPSVLKLAFSSGHIEVIPGSTQGHAETETRVISIDQLVHKNDLDA